MNHVRLSKLPLKQKLTFVIMLAPCVVVTLVLVAVLGSEVLRFLESTYRHVGAIADVISFHSRAPLQFNDQAASKETLDALAKDKSIVAAAIYDAKGQVFATYGNVDDADRFPKTPQRGAHYVQGWNLFWFSDITVGSEYLGSVLVVGSIHSLIEKLRMELILAIVVLGCSIIAAYFVARKFQFIILAPVYHLLDVVKSVSRSKDYSLRADSKWEDELGLLVDGCNEMLCQIQERDSMLEDHRKSLEGEVAKRTAELHAVVDTAPDAIVVCKSSGQVVSLNDTAKELFGIAPDRVPGLHVSVLVEKWEQGLAQNHAGAAKPNLTKMSTEYRGKHRDGHLFPMEMTVSTWETGGEKMMTLISRDISKKRMLEAQLLQAQKLESIGQLAAGVAHEINTPIQYVGDNLRFIRDEFPALAEIIRSGPHHGTNAAQSSENGEAVCPDSKGVDIEYSLEEIPKAIEQAIEGSERVAEIVRSLKEFSHPLSKEKARADINRAIESTVSVSRNEWKYVADLELKLERDLPLVPCYLGELNQVILNLVINAAHAIEDVVGKKSGKMGKIVISTRKENDFAIIEIRDSGTGIPRAIRDRLFDPFFTTKQIGRGTGQGLAIAHAIIAEQHKGTITFDSVEGEGTTFVISLPLGDLEEGDRMINEKT